MSIPTQHSHTSTLLSAIFGDRHSSQIRRQWPTSRFHLLLRWCVRYCLSKSFPCLVWSLFVNSYAWRYGIDVLTLFVFERKGESATSFSYCPEVGEERFGTEWGATVMKLLCEQMALLLGAGACHNIRSCFFSRYEFWWKSSLPALYFTSICAMGLCLFARQPIYLVLVTGSWISGRFRTQMGCLFSIRSNSDWSLKSVPCLWSVYRTSFTCCFSAV